MHVLQNYEQSQVTKGPHCMYLNSLFALGSQAVSNVLCDLTGAIDFGCETQGPSIHGVGTGRGPDVQYGTTLQNDLREQFLTVWGE